MPERESLAGECISSTCEVVMKWGPPVELCGFPTVAGYAASGGGWMALCTGHVHPHEKYVYPIEDIRSGVAQWMQSNGSRG